MLVFFIFFCCDLRCIRVVAGCTIGGGGNKKCLFLKLKILRNDFCFEARFSVSLFLDMYFYSFSLFSLDLQFLGVLIFLASAIF